MPEDLTLETLQFTLPGWQATYGEGPTTSVLQSGGDAVIVQETADTLTVRSVTRIDLQGWTSRLDQTFYPTNIGLQRAFTYGWISGTAGDALWDCVFIMPRELTDEEQTQLLDLSYPAFLGDDQTTSSSIDKQQVLWGSWSFVPSNNTINAYGVPMDGSTFGTGLPTLANRLWIYRFVHVAKGGSATIVRCPGLLGMLDGAFGKEPDMEYMERLRRTFVLASDLQ